MEPISKAIATSPKPAYLDNNSEKTGFKKNMVLNESGLPIYPQVNNSKGSNKLKLVQPELVITSDNKEILLKKIRLITKNIEQSIKEDELRFSDKNVQIGKDRIEINNSGEIIYINDKKEEFNVLKILENMTPRQQIIMELCLRVYNDMNISTSKLVTTMSGLYQELIKEQASQTKSAAITTLGISFISSGITGFILLLSAISAIKEPGAPEMTEQQAETLENDIQKQQEDINKLESSIDKNEIDQNKLTEAKEQLTKDEKKIRKYNKATSTSGKRLHKTALVTDKLALHSHLFTQVINASGRSIEEYLRSTKEIKEANKNNAHTAEQTSESQISSSVQAKNNMLEIMHSIVNTILSTDQALVDNMRKS